MLPRDERFQRIAFGEMGVLFFWQDYEQIAERRRTLFGIREASV